MTMLKKNIFLILTTLRKSKSIQQSIQFMKTKIQQIQQNQLYKWGHKFSTIISINTSARSTIYVPSRWKSNLNKIPLNWSVFHSTTLIFLDFVFSSTDFASDFNTEMVIFQLPFTLLSVNTLAPFISLIKSWGYKITFYDSYAGDIHFQSEYSDIMPLLSYI